MRSSPRCRRLGGAALASFTLALTLPALVRAQAPSLAELLDVGALELQEIDVPQQLTEDVAILLQLDGEDAALAMHRQSMRAADFEVLVDDGVHLTPAALPPVRTYQGEVYRVGDAVPIGTVAASLKDGALHAYLRLADGRILGIQPVAEVMDGVPANLHATYDAADVIAEGHVCGVDGVAFRDHGPTQPGPGGAIKAATGLKVCEIGFDADVEFYQKNGSSVPNTVFDIENVMNGVESIYENETGITYELTKIIVRTAEADPYSTSDSSSLLSQFRSHWIGSQSVVKRDVAHLMTGKNLSGSVIGVAYLSVICSSNMGYGLSESRFTTNFTFRVALTAHELGHNWSAQHCSGGTCHIMCSGIGGCSGNMTLFGAGSANQIINHKNSRTCLADEQSPVALPFFESFPSSTLNVAHWAWNDDAEINSNGVGEPSPTLSLNLDASSSADNADDEVRTNFVLLAGQTQVTVSYFTEHRGPESGEQLVVEYWNNNKTWKPLNTIVSNGSTQSAFVAHSHILPSDALHNEFRMRFRAEVNETNDDWYVDDVRIESAPVTSPTISNLAPNSVQVLNPPTVTINGTNFINVQSVKVGAQTLTPGTFNVVDAFTITFAPPAPSVLGPQTVTVTNQIGTSNGVTLSYNAVSPPSISGPAGVSNGQLASYSWAGDPLDQTILIINIAPTSFPFQGWTLLDPWILLVMPSNDSLGLGGFSFTPNGIPAFTSLYFQVWLFDQGATTTQSLKASNIHGTFVF